MRKMTVLVIGVFALLLMDCKQKPLFLFEIDEALLQEGDLVFRRGLSIASRVVLAADKEGGYSHVGIIVKDSTNWYVIHAVPGETDKEYPIEIIKKETLPKFFAPEKAAAGAIFRLDTCEVFGCLAAQKAKILFDRKLLFDHDYDLKDSTKMYCTELIYFAYNYAGIDISEGRRSKYPAIRNEFILPSDILESPKLKLVWAQ
jgi:hypothetical protein